MIKKKKKKDSSQSSIQIESLIKKVHLKCIRFRKYILLQSLKHCEIMEEK